MKCGFFILHPQTVPASAATDSPVILNLFLDPSCATIFVMQTSKQKIEFPKAVQLIAAVLMAKPLMDILMMQLTDAQNYSWISWLLLFAAGISLLVRHKTAWMFSIGLCAAFMVSTGFSFVQEFDPAEPLLNIAKIVDCILVFIVVGTVAYYFRYPYLDRRQSWLAPTADRFAVSTSVILGTLHAQTVDVSYTGANILNTNEALFRVGEKVPLQFKEIEDIHCVAKIIDVQGQNVRVQFEGFSAAQTNILRQWLHTHHNSKV